MRRRYMVAYDVSDAKRLRKTYRTMHGFGDPVQYSLFVCDLSATEKQLMVERLSQLLNLSEDRVLIADLGETGSARASAIDVIGRQLEVDKDPYQAVIL